jgi:hypothetical protein
MLASQADLAAAAGPSANARPRPPTGPREGVCPFAAGDAEAARRAVARRVDEALAGLAREEARCRLALGRLCRALLLRRAYDGLGFVRVGDYARERLGLSAREVQCLVQVGWRLEQLPATADAFARGALSWTQVRALVRVAALATEAAWIERARGLTARELEDVVDEACGGRRARGGRHRTGGDAPPDRSQDAGAPPGPSQDAGAPPPLDAVAAAAGDDAGLVDGEPAARLRLHCPRRVRALWRATVELARRVAGEPLPLWQAAEAIAAEGLSGAPRSSAAADLRQDDLQTTHVERLSGTSRPSATGWPAERLDDRGGATLACGHDDAAGRGRRHPRRRSRRARTRVARHGNGHARTARGVAASASDALGADVAGALAAASSAWPETAGPGVEELARDAASLDAFALDARLRAVMDVMRTIDARTARLLRVLADARLYALRGFPSLSRYVDDRLGICRRKAWALLAVERASAAAPALAEAWRAGAISWLRALTIRPVLYPGVDAAWVIRAREVVLRRLVDEVNWALDVHDLSPGARPVAPPPPGAELTRPAASPQGLDGVPQSEARPDGTPPDARGWMHAGAPVEQVQSRAPAEEAQSRAPGARREAETGGSPHTSPDAVQSRAPRAHDAPEATVTIYGPASVIALVRQAIHAFAEAPEPAWRSFARLLDHVRAEWERQPKHRDPIFARDGWRCQVPACSARRNLHDHHIRYRSRGGGNARANRITVCAAHHLRGIHVGAIEARGTAPDRVHWRLGVRPGRAPWLRFVGDRYVGTRA